MYSHTKNVTDETRDPITNEQELNYNQDARFAWHILLS